MVNALLTRVKGWFFESSYPDTAYSGASFQRKEIADWMPVTEPPDAELLPERDTLVARSRDLDRNHGIAASGFQTLVDNVVGTGLRLAASPDYRAMGKDIDWAEAWARRTEGLWRAWSEEPAFDVARRLNFHQATALIFRTIMVSGEAIVLPLWREEPDSDYATCFQFIEGDRLSNPNNEPDTTKRRGGIEIDEFGKAQAYWIRQEAKGDFLLPYGSWDFGNHTWERIPARTEWGRRRVLHLYDQDRFSQSRGKPILTSVLEQFKLFDHYQRTEMQSAIVNSLVAGVIETPMDQAQIADLMGGDPNQYLANKTQWKTRLKGGAMIPLFPGDKLAPFTPTRPNPQYDKFVETVLRHIGAAMNMPYELLHKDFSKTNYSSARAALLEAWRYFLSRRKWLSDNWTRPVYRLWLEEAVNRGFVDAPDFYDSYAYYTKSKWIGGGRGWIDPVKEVQAAQIRLDAKISTLEMECAEQGNDYQDVLEQLALEQKKQKELGIWVDPAPVTARGAAAKGGSSIKRSGGTDPDTAGEDYGE